MLVDAEQMFAEREVDEVQFDEAHGGGISPFRRRRWKERLAK